MGQALFDALEVANALRGEHGPAALDLASRTAREHLKQASWMSGAQWLRVVDHLKAQPSGANTTVATGS